MDYDVAIIGGGVAGSQAALTLARMCRRVLLIDDGRPRNAAAGHMHNWLGADGLSHKEFAARVDKELAHYPEITRVKASIVKAEGASEKFQLTDSAGKTYASRTILLAVGATDRLPTVEGIQLLWGKTVHQCTLCHGYEVKGQSIGGLVADPAYAVAWAQSFLSLTQDMTLYFNGIEPDMQSRMNFSRAKVKWETARITRLEPAGKGMEVVLESGERREHAAFYVSHEVKVASPLPAMLGCKMNDYGVIEIDQWGRTNVAGVYAAGDAAHHVKVLVTAAAHGMEVAATIHTELTRKAS